MTEWERIVAAGKAHSTWNRDPRASKVGVLNGRPMQIIGTTAVKRVQGRRGWNVVTFRYLDDMEPAIDQMPAARFNVAVRREYKRLSK